MTTVEPATARWRSIAIVSIVVAVVAVLGMLVLLLRAASVDNRFRGSGVVRISTCPAGWEGTARIELSQLDGTSKLRAIVGNPEPDGRSCKLPFVVDGVEEGGGRYYIALYVGNGLKGSPISVNENDLRSGNVDIIIR